MENSGRRTTRGSAGALGDGQWRVDLAGVHVLLDDGEHVDAEALDGGQKRRHVRDSARRFGHRAQLDGLAERQVLGLDLGPHLGVDLLEVQVADPLGARSMIAMLSPPQ